MTAKLKKIFNYENIVIFDFECFSHFNNIKHVFGMVETFSIPFFIFCVLIQKLIRIC